MELQLVQQLVPLPDDLIRQKVLKQFNLIDYNKNFNLLKQWFEDETLSVCDDNYQNQIHVVLRGSKNDFTKARKRLTKFFLNKNNGYFPEWYKFYDLSQKFLEYKNFYCLCQPGITPEGHRITCLGFTTSDLTYFDIDVLNQSIFMTDHLGMCLGHPDFIGIISIVDCRHVTVKHALKILSWTFRRYAKFQNEIMPYRLVKLYMVNVPRYIEKFVTIGKAFLGEKLRTRFCIEQSDIEMRQQIPKELLPADYGGDGESVAVQTKKWFELLNSLRPWYEAEFAVRLRKTSTNATGATESNTKSSSSNCKQVKSMRKYYKYSENTKNTKEHEELVGDNKEVEDLQKTQENETLKFNFHKLDFD